MADIDVDMEEEAPDLIDAGDPAGQFQGSAAYPGPRDRKTQKVPITIVTGTVFLFSSSSYSGLRVCYLLIIVSRLPRRR